MKTWTVDKSRERFEAWYPLSGIENGDTSAKVSARIAWQAAHADLLERIKAGESASSGEYPYINIVKLAWSKLRERDCLPEELHEGDMVRALQAVTHLLPTQPSTSQAQVRIGAPAWPGQLEGQPPPEGWVQLSENNRSKPELHVGDEV